MLHATGASGKEPLPAPQGHYAKGQLSLREALAACFDLRSPRGALLELLAKRAAGEEAQELRALLSEEGGANADRNKALDKWLSVRHVSDILEGCPSVQLTYQARRLPTCAPPAIPGAHAKRRKWRVRPALRGRALSSRLSVVLRAGAPAGPEAAPAAPLLHLLVPGARGRALALAVPPRALKRRRTQFASPHAPPCARTRPPPNHLTPAPAPPPRSSRPRAACRSRWPPCATRRSTGPGWCAAPGPPPPPGGIASSLSTRTPTLAHQLSLHSPRPTRASRHPPGPERARLTATAAVPCLPVLLQGVCSTFLGERLNLGETAPVYVTKNPEFRLPGARGRGRLGGRGAAGYVRRAGGCGLVSSLPRAPLNGCIRPTPIPQRRRARR